MYGPAISKDIELPTIDNDQIINEFFFVVLGGYGISYELNLSALKILKTKGFLNHELYITKEISNNTAMLLRKELDTRQFEPVTKNGFFRRYRFIETKPINIAFAGNWFWEECNWDFITKIKEFDNRDSRKWLCQCPGFGMKSASWFLRNTRINNDCAVFDVHVLRFLSRIGFEIPESLTVKEYLQLENKLRTVCYKIGVSLGAMDYLLWILGRNGFLAHVG